MSEIMTVMYYLRKKTIKANIKGGYLYQCMHHSRKNGHYLTWAAGENWYGTTSLVSAILNAQQQTYPCEVVMELSYRTDAPTISSTTLIPVYQYHPCNILKVGLVPNTRKARLPDDL